LPLDENEMVSVLEMHVKAVHSAIPDMLIGLNGAPGDLDSALRMARAFYRAGGDIFELNCHGGYAPLLERGLLRGMMMPDQRIRLHEWLQELCMLQIPIVVKFNGTVTGIDVIELLDSIRDIRDLFGVHFNVRDSEETKPNTGLVRLLRPKVDGVLFCSGFVTGKEHVRALEAAGADCIGVAQGIRDNPTIIRSLT
jgi:hypothetical protein